jgi:hypothetical protein
MLTGRNMLEAHLQVPPQNEEEELGTVKEDIKCQSPRSEEFALKPVFSHGVGRRVSLSGLQKERKEDEEKKEEDQPKGEEGETENKGGD